MSLVKTPIHSLSLSLIVIPSLWFSTCAHADLLDLSNKPPFISGQHVPNILFLFDDSDSMDWEVLTKDHWHHCAYDPAIGTIYTSTSCGWWVTENVIRSYGNAAARWFTYVHHQSDNFKKDDCQSEDNNAMEACAESSEHYDWRGKSASVNTIYYSPSMQYTPWMGPCLKKGTACKNANFASAHSNPREGTKGYSSVRNLNGFRYHIWIDDKSYEGNRPERGINVNVSEGPNGKVDLWDSHLDVVFKNDLIEIHKVSYKPNTLGMNPTDRVVATLNDKNACYNILGSETTVLKMLSHELNLNATHAPGCRTISQAKTNIANWYEYARRRGYVTKGIVAKIINQYPNFRYGFTSLNKKNALFIEMPAEGDDVKKHNQKILSTLFDLDWSNQDTSLALGLETAGKYFANQLPSAKSPIVSPCQQNYTVIFTDGESNHALSKTIQDEDRNGSLGTLADVAAFYYNNDLSPLPNVISKVDNEMAPHQHMVTIVATLDNQGSLSDTDGDGWPDNAKTTDWGNPSQSKAAKVDDMWHAAYNSHGVFTLAYQTDPIFKKISSSLKNISLKTSSATRVAQNTPILKKDAVIYQATFTEPAWFSDFKVFDLTMDFKKPLWNAGCLLTGRKCQSPQMTEKENPGLNDNERIIITRSWDNAQKGIPFRWPSDIDALKFNETFPNKLYDFMAYAPFDLLSTDPSEIKANNAYGLALLNYIRGARTYESSQKSLYKFRNRISLLGDIIHSDPLFVTGPHRLYPDHIEAEPYSKFQNRNRGRTNMVYVGANDGMLHAFDASTGKELMAYIPGHRDIYKKLPQLSSTNYDHQYFVDGPVSEGDVYANGWKTILVGSLGQGGQGIYALDVTDPSEFSEARASKTYLFEFTDENDPDLGYVLGKVSIAKVRAPNGKAKWALIFGNGYNNSQNDGFSSKTGKAYLYIIYIENAMKGIIGPQDYIKIPVGTGSVQNPNGLSTPYVVDYDGDFIVEYVYAGDLQGNLWKFDLRNPDPNQWASKTTALFQASYQTPGDQPITSQPIVGPHPQGLSKGLMIYFGTGKYLGRSDNNIHNSVIQSFYGIWDKLDGTIPTNNTLLKQSILAEDSVSISTGSDKKNTLVEQYRLVSNLPMTTSGPAQHLGWRLDLALIGDLPSQGERQVTQALLRDNLVIFTTLIPAASGCGFSASGWLMELNASNGGQTIQSPFDINQDGLFNSGDKIIFTGLDQEHATFASGKKIGSGITPTPAVFISTDRKKELKILNGSLSIEKISENPAANLNQNPS